MEVRTHVDRAGLDACGVHISSQALLSNKVLGVKPL